MAKQREASYGSWRSPITAAMLADGIVALGQVKLEGNTVYWVEERPSEQGRSVVVRWTEAEGACDITPHGFSASTRVHEYGGGAYCVGNGVIFFSNFEDQRLYRQAPGESPSALTSEGHRYADGVFDSRRNRIICVREDHTAAEREAVNTLVAVDAVHGGDGLVLAEGHDFYSSPRLSPDGAQLAWLAWRHPNMPWTATELWLADITDDGGLGNVRCIEGAAGGESIVQPVWSPDGQLYFVSDRTGWWNVYRWGARGAQAVAPMEAEFALPQWLFGIASYGFVDASTLLCTSIRDGVATLNRLDLATGAITPLSVFSQVNYLQVGPAGAFLIAGTPTENQSVFQCDPGAGKLVSVRASAQSPVDPAYISPFEAIDFPTTGGALSHALFYPPHNPLYCAPVGERPPLMVISHGGPTGASMSTLDLEIQFWTSRGFAVLDVNYRGSTGYGRAYRELLNGQWGIADVEDCINGARALAERGRVDGGRLVIRGGSAGGYTTLMALVSSNVFAAGASYFGVSDVEALALETHKFESRYMDWLIGPYPAQRELYRARSPITYVDQLSTPVIFFQGLDDKVVLPNQAELMVDALRNKGISVAYVAYEGEGHGFRRAANIIHSQEAELAFYARVLGLTPADELPEIEIVNLSTAARDAQ